MKRQQDIQRIFEDFKGVKNIPGISSAKKRVLITKIKNEEGEIITSRKGIGEPYKKLYDDTEKVETEQEFGENEIGSNIDVHSSNTNVTVRIPDITTEELRTAINKLKKKQIPTQQLNQSSRHQSMRWWDERNGETNLQRIHKAERAHTSGMEESENKSDTQRRRCGRS